MVWRYSETLPGKIQILQNKKNRFLCKVYSVVHGSASKYPKMGFSMASKRHSISTRHSVQSLVLPHKKNHQGPKYFSFRSAKCGMFFQPTLNQLLWILPLSIGLEIFEWKWTEGKRTSSFMASLR